VRGYFIRDKNFVLNEKVATVIAQIACHENALPQGSPCSPVISNLIAHVLDTHLVRLASRVGCTYSRYADDLTFSTNKKPFPREIAIASDGNCESLDAGSGITRGDNAFWVSHQSCQDKYAIQEFTAGGDGTCGEQTD